MRTCNARPYRFGGFLNIRPIEEGFPIPTNLHKKREAERLPYGQNIKIRTYFVGDDVLGVPFVRHNATISLLQWEKVPRNEADEVSLT